MTTPGPIPLDLDASGYLSSLGQAEQGTQSFTTTLRGIPVALAPVQRAMDSITPKRAALAGFAALAATAANTQQQLAGMQAQSKVTGVNFNRLTGDMRNLAKQFPIGNRGAQEMVKTLTAMGVAGAGTDKALNQTSKNVERLRKSMVATVPGVDKFLDRWDDAFGTKGKVSDPGTTRRVAGLSSAFVKLGAATNENATVVARGMVQLNRAMNTGLGVDRVEKLNDSLTTVSARTGASASGILEFSRMIAPMARSAGIGQTAVMGIAGAFSQMGEDGFGASTAVNKIMSDLSRAVREGTPNMAAYAEMVGKTRGEFEALFKQNPAEALLQITEALGNDPANAPRMLESVGLEGVRTQRALQAASQSGLLRNSVNTAVGAYGNGMTERAAAESMDGLIDSSQRAAAAAEQLGEALGRPLLGPLTMFTDALGAATSGVSGAAGNRAVQTAMSAAIALAIPALIGAKLIGPALIASGIGQLATSGPFRSFLGAVAMGMAGGDPDRARRTLPGRLGGRDAIDRVERGDPLGGTQRWNERNQRIYAGRGNAIGGFIGMGDGGPGLLRQVGQMGAVATGMYIRMQSEQFRQIQTRSGFDRTPSRMAAFGDAADRFSARLASIREQRDAGTLDRGGARQEVRTAFGQFRREIDQAGGAVRGFRTQVLLGTAALARNAAGAGASLVGRGAGAVSGLFGGPLGLALTGGLAGYGMYRGMVGRREEQDEQRNAASGLVDDYRVAMGKATDATETFSGRMAQAADTMVNSVTSMADAMSVDERDIIAAAAVRDRPIRRFQGTPEAVGRQLAMEQQTYGMTPDEVARIGLDLYNQLGGAQQAEQALSFLNPGGRPQGALAQRTDMTGRVNDLVNAPDRGGFRANAGKLFDANRWAGNWGWTIGKSGDDRGYGWYTNTLSDETRQGTFDIGAGVEAREAQRTRLYGAGFGRQEARREMDQAVQTAMDRGDNAQVQELARTFQVQQGMNPAASVPFQEIMDAGGITNWMARRDEAVAGRYGTEAPEREARPVERAGLTFDLLQGAGSSLRGAFDERSTNADPRSAATRALLANPENPQRQIEALSAFAQSADRSSAGLVRLANEAGRSAEAQGNVASAGYQLLAAVRTMATQLLQASAPFQTAGQNAMQQVQLYAGSARLRGSTDETKAEREGGRQGLIGMQAEAVGAAVQKLTQVREQQVAARRQGEDYNTQREYAGADFTRSRERAVADFGRQRERMVRQYNLQTERAEFDFQLSVTRSEADFHTQRLRGERDFGISMTQATEDYNKARFRAQRDFDLQLRRQIEDSARTLYDPYARIQVAPTWDMGSLTGNLREQTDALRSQLENLGRLRGVGVSQGAMDLLGLSDPKNAQQLQQTVNDLMNDPTLVNTLNGLASDRLDITTALVGDPSNTATRRAVEDLGRGLGDMATDFETQTERSVATYRRSQDDATTDFGKMMDRQYADFTRQLQRAQTDLNITLDQMGIDHRTALQRAETDQGISMGRMADAQTRLLQRIGEDVVRMDQVVVGDLETLTGALNLALSGQVVDFTELTRHGLADWAKVLEQFISGDLQALIHNISSARQEAEDAARGTGAWRQGLRAGDGPGYGADVYDIPGEPPQVDHMMSLVRKQFGTVRLHSGFRPNAVTATGKPSYHGMGRAVDLPPKMEIFNWIRDNYGSATKELIFSPASGREVNNGNKNYDYTGITDKNHWDHIHWAMAKGGVATGPTKVLVGEARDNEAIIPLNQGGITMLAAAMDLHLSHRREFVDAQAHRGTTHIHYSSDSYTYDHSQVIEHVELKADDPNAMLDKLAEIQRRSNLTRPPQQRGRRG